MSGWFYAVRRTLYAVLLFGDRAVESFEDNRDQVVTLGAFDLLESLDIVVLGAVHDGEDLRHEIRFISRPMTTRTRIKWFH